MADERGDGRTQPAERGVVVARHEEVEADYRLLERGTRGLADALAEG